MKKKNVANILTVLIILAVAVSGVAFVGHIQGWFDMPDESVALLTDFRGIITLERDGVAYTASEDTVLRIGDKLTCDTGATVKITVGDGYVALGQSAKAIVTDPTVSNFAMEVTNGEAFVNAEAAIRLSFDGKQAEFSDAAATLSVRKGAQSISVYYGSVDGVQSGQMLEWVGGNASVRELTVNSLNDFNISQIRKANTQKTLCITNTELDILEAERRPQLEASDSASDHVTEPDNTSGFDEASDFDDNLNSENTPSEGSVTVPDGISQSDEPDQNITSEPEKTDASETEPKLSCTITVRCDAVLDNWDDLDPAKAPYVPESGCILPVITVEFDKGETVFDVLNRVCREYGIQLEYSHTPINDSYYVEGINNLYEFDCGVESGWAYTVNGRFTNYGCSDYQLAGGENIVWYYTCSELGKAVGADGW